MATDLTTPITDLVGVTQILTHYEYRFEIGPSGDIDYDASFVKYIVKTLNAAGQVIDALTEIEIIPYNDLSSQYKAQFNSLHALNLADAKSKGRMGPGTDRNDILGGV